jgi:phosphate-selective porin OprO/OprP
MNQTIYLRSFLVAVMLALAPVWAAAQDPGAGDQSAGAPKKAKKAKKGKKNKANKKAKRAKKAGEAAEAPQSSATAADSTQVEPNGLLDEKYQADEREKPAKRYVRFEFKKHPSVRMGKWFRADFRLKFQHDFRSFDPEVEGDEGETTNLRKFRVGVEGYVTKDLEYSVEREIRNEVADLFNLRTRPTHALWRDVYGNYRHFRRFQIRAGQFKIPFGMDQLHFSTNGEFVYRSLIGNYLAPGRDQGIMVHGKLFESNVAYQAGVFVHDGWKAHTAVAPIANTEKVYDYGGERAIAGRVVLPPFKMFEGPRFLKPFKNLQLGGAFTESPLTEGQESLRGRTWVITHNWFDRIWVRGHRLRLGAELDWEPGPFTVKGEVMRVSDQRLGQGLRDENLPDVIGRGWYLTTAWVLTGEKAAGGIEPRREFIKGRGIGAVQIAARYEQLRYGSAEHPGLPSRSSRAPNIYSESERVATFGVNWYLNRFTRIQFDHIREVVEDREKVPIPGQDTYWSHFVRVQFVF